jgi:hypothetical protein
MDLLEEKARVIEASDAERAALVDSIAARATPQELVQIASWLTDEAEAVRRAAIGVIEEAGFKPAIGALCAVARARAGAERLAAILALTRIADRDDREKVGPLLSLPVADVDEKSALERLAVVVEHAQPEQTATEFGLLSSDQATRRAALVRVLQHADDPVASLADSLLETRADGVRMDLLGGLATLGGEQLLAAAERVTPRADDDLLALFARQLARKLGGDDNNLRARAAVLLEKSRGRVSSVVTHAALDSAALTLVPARAVRALAETAAELDDDGAAELADAFAALDVDGRLGATPALITSLTKALARHPGRIARFAAPLLDVEGELPVAVRSQLGGLVLKAAAGAGDDPALSRAQGDVARLAARVLLPGTPLPKTLALGLSLSPDAADREALVALCAALATEECALELVKLAREEGPAGEAAREALASFSSTEARVLQHPGDKYEVLPAYADAHGEALVASGRELKDRAGRAWVLEAEGPVLAAETPWGGCACCFRPRALEDARGKTDRPTCPVTGRRHLIDDDGPVLEESHPLGGCDECDSVRPLSRDGDRVECRTCHTRYRREGDRLKPFKARTPQIPGPDGTLVTVERDNAVPELNDDMRPPTEDDLLQLPIDVQTAMRASVVLYGKGAFHNWGGTGLCVAHDGAEIAVLTTRHSVEETRGPGLGARVPLTCMTIAGEVAETRLLWAGRQGLDLALLGVKLQRPEEVMSVHLPDGARAKLGDPLFAVGHELSCPWSYYEGAVSAIRSLRTSYGLEVKYVQTAMVLPSGTGGGGLFHKDGRLAGLVSWFRRGGTNETNFAIAVESVVAALRRDRVKFGGGRLV